ncbi:DUF4147 domain-containing protein [uncultured Tateyamaria sp.]|uniref:DUF4147 domain-containing protein n=1 Tax=uncultured Tateyamaria sp. TaxID=455651 RepID=UPI0026159CE3|nr:DUF4147 domain-containing protein [uncultured Tateyamaria sp.]
MKNAADLVALWQIGVDAVRGDAAVARALTEGRISKPSRIVAVGKAATAMATPAATAWPDVPCLIITKYGHAANAPAHAKVIEAAHPVPDAASLAAGRALQAAISACPAGSEVLMLVSGGASSLVEVPIEDQSLETLMASTQELLAAGAPIGEMNAHRTAQSQIKGGKLLAGFLGARVTTLALSDVEGDALMTIGSGIGAAPPNPAFAFHSEIIASNAIARSAIAAASPLPVQHNSETLYDDVVALAPRIAATLTAGAAGLYVFGGEPVVQLPATPGLGGRNMALALGLAREIAGRDDIRILVAGTDGTDGPTDAAGACVDGTTWDDSGADALARADAYPWLEARGALVKTGPTGTNVMDVLIAHKGSAR